MSAGFTSAMMDSGIDPPAEVVADGVLHRFHISEDRAGSENGWYVLHGDEPAAGAFGSWKTGVSGTWSAKNRETMTPGERTAYAGRMNAIRTARQVAEEQRHAECRTKAGELWAAAGDVAADHPYLVAKQIRPYGIKQIRESLVVPVRDAGGVLQGLQFIQPDGGKKFMTGTAVTGCYLSIGKPSGAVLICEGYATGATLHEATNQAVAISFNAGNLLPVAERLRAKLPDTAIVICADDDWQTPSNPGRTKATEAAQAVDGLLAVPVFFGDRGQRDTDFNDLMRLAGADAVNACILAAAPPEDDDTAPPEDETTPADEWGEPLLFGEIETPDIPCDILPDPFGAFGAFGGAMTQTPAGLSVMFALSVLATCLQGKFEVAPFGDEYTEPLNLWTVTSLEPGTRKTAVKNEMTRPLSDWERNKTEEMKTAIRENAHILDLAKRRIDALKTKAAKPDTESADRDDLLRQIFKIEMETPLEIHAPRLWVDDVTAERLQALLVDHGERMSLISDEGGIFEVMAGLYSGGKFNNNVFLQSHAGSPVRVDRQGRTVTLNKPALTFGLAIQPSVLSDLGQGNKGRFRGNGTLARFLYCLPKSTVGHRNVALHKQIPEQVKSAYHQRVSSLLDIPKIYDEQGLERARILTLSPTAKTLWLDFAQGIENRLGADGDLYPLQDWGGKLPGAVLRIGGLFHVAEYGETTPIINDLTMTRAIRLGDLLIPHAKAAFGQMGDDEAVSDAKIILQWLTNSRLVSFTEREALKRHESRLKKADRLRKALGELVERQIISTVEVVQTKGRPTKMHRVNPKIHETGHPNFGRTSHDKSDKSDKSPTNPPTETLLSPFVPFVERGNTQKQTDLDLSEDELSEAKFYEG